MTIAPTNKSEIARIRQKIREEDEASLRAMHGLSVTAKHQFINKRLTDTVAYVEGFMPVIGEDAVTEIVNWWQVQLVNDIRRSEGAHA